VDVNLNVSLPSILPALIVLVALCVGGCDSKYGHPVEVQTTHTAHPPNHGGVMVEFGNEFAHLEFVHDRAAGTLTAHATDSDGKTSLRLTQDYIPVEILFGGSDGKIMLEMGAVENAETGEVAGDTCTFSASHERLRDAKWFEAVVKAIIIKDRHFATTAFKITHIARKSQ
jgi:hypothetical protein